MRRLWGWADSPQPTLFPSAKASQSQGKETSQEAFPRACSLQAFLSTQLTKFDVIRDNFGWRKAFAVVWNFPASSKPHPSDPRKETLT